MTFEEEVAITTFWYKEDYVNLVQSSRWFRTWEYWAQLSSPFCGENDKQILLNGPYLF